MPIFAILPIISAAMVLQQVPRLFRQHLDQLQIRKLVQLVGRALDLLALDKHLQLGASKLQRCIRNVATVDKDFLCLAIYGYFDRSTPEGLLEVIDQRLERALSSS